jgi:hypothetical protein
MAASHLDRDRPAADAGMRTIERIALGIWDFVVGDDWRVALGVVVAIGATAVIAASGVAAWWVSPIAVVALLADSLRRASG